MCSNNYNRVGLLKRYRDYLPVTDKTPDLSLMEGSTPLIPLDNLSAKISPNVTVYAKFEGMNPTGSFKDRGMVMAMAKAVEEGSRGVICASTGNTAASAAAYAARAGITCCVILPRGEVAMGKVSQSLMHGAVIISVDGNFDDALTIVRTVAENYPHTLVNSVNPYRIEGQKTGSFEIIDALGDAPTYHAIPVGNAGNITAYWKGYREYYEKGKASHLPKMLGFQAAGAAPSVKGEPVEFPETRATAIRIGNPASWKFAAAARDESGGVIEAVTDEEITDAQKLLARCEGVFCEPASAASLAGVIKKAREGFFTEPSSVVCVLTGHGLKDPKRAVEICPPILEAPASLDAVIEILENHKPD